MSGNIDRTEVEKVLVNEFLAFRHLFDLGRVDIRRSKNITSIYLVGRNALELEIDWHENALFMYVVHLINGKIPSDDVIYKYDDGIWCRIYIDEIYKQKNPIYQSKKRMSSCILFELFQYYKRLIESNPSMLYPYFESME